MTDRSVLGMVPGTRLAFGARWGSPAAVDPVEIGESADDLAVKAPLHAGPHRARWREFADRGELLMIGPFANALEDGAMGIFTTREAAEEFVRGDPFVLHGVVRNWTIREWNEALVPDR